MFDTDETSDACMKEFLDLLTANQVNRQMLIDAHDILP
jgi:hypothetical protein